MTPSPAMTWKNIFHPSEERILQRSWTRACSRPWAVPGRPHWILQALPNDQHTKSCKNPPLLIGMCNTCKERDGTASPSEWWNGCHVASPLSTQAWFSRLPCPALLLLSQRSFEELEKPHWSTDAYGGAQAFRAWCLEDFLCSGSAWEDTRLGFPLRSETNSARALASLLPTRAPAIKQADRAI